MRISMTKFGSCTWSYPGASVSQYSKMSCNAGRSPGATFPPNRETLTSEYGRSGAVGELVLGC